MELYEGRVGFRLMEVLGFIGSRTLGVKDVSRGVGLAPCHIRRYIEEKPSLFHVSGDEAGLTISLSDEAMSILSSQANATIMEARSEAPVKINVPVFVLGELAGHMTKSIHTRDMIVEIDEGDQRLFNRIGRYEPRKSVILKWVGNRLETVGWTGPMCLARRGDLVPSPLLQQLSKPTEAKVKGPINATSR